MQEAETRHCVYCKVEKSWIWAGKKLKDGSKIYTSSAGKRWAGRRCPDCERSRVQAAVRCDSFEKDIILSQLINSGYKILSKTLPLKVEKDGKELTVGFKRAFTEKGKITIESNNDLTADVFALVFESVRICDASQMSRLSSSFGVYDKQVIEKEHIPTQ